MCCRGGEGLARKLTEADLDKRSFGGVVRTKDGRQREVGRGRGDRVVITLEKFVLKRS